MSKSLSRESHRSSVARHVYLRTQEHRLRHVKSIVVRNLTLSDTSIDLSWDPLAITTHFTIHPTLYPDKVLYKSEQVFKSYNPSWESVQFTPQEYSKYSALPSFILKLWVEVKEKNEMLLGFEKTIQLSSQVYLGSLINKDGSGYPPNSIILGMFEGYYSHPGVGGVPGPPRITHSLEKLLPPQSLLEVQKSEVHDSYLQHVLMRLLNRQEMLNRTVSEAKLAHDNVEILSKIEEAFFKKRSERELLKMRVTILRKQLADQEKEEDEERKQFSKLCNELDTQETMLTEGFAHLKQRKDRLKLDSEEFYQQKEMLLKAKKNQLLRQRNMISEVAATFFISERRDKFTICNVILPNADQLDQPNSQEQPGVALGYVAQLVHHLSKILLVPLQYEIKPNGSRSYICDFISDEPIIDNIREFPLFLKGSEKALFHYAVHLLNKNIAQIRQHCGYGTSKSMQKKTLPNLKLLLDKIFRELSDTPSISRQEYSLFSSPTDLTASLNSIAVPQGRRKLLERHGTTSSSPSRASFLTEQEMYSSSPSSAMSFLQSDDASGDSRQLSPLQLPSSQDSTINSAKGDHSFQFSVGQSQSSPVALVVTAGNSSSSNNSNTQQYPAMLDDTQGHHYPLPVQNRSRSPSLPVLSPVLLTQLTKDKGGGHEVTCEHSVSPDGQSTIMSQSFAHADLHRTKQTVSSDHPFSALDQDEERVSGGVLTDNGRNSPSYSSARLRIRSNAFNGSLKTQVISNSDIELTDHTSGKNCMSEPAPMCSLKTNISSNCNTNNAGTIPNPNPNTTGNGLFHQQSQTQDIELEADSSKIVPQHLNNEDTQNFHIYSTTHDVGDSSAGNNRCMNTSVGSVTNTLTSDNISKAIPSSFSTAGTASYQHTLIETGYVKSVVATPHMVVKTEEMGHVPSSSLISPRQFSTKSTRVGLNMPRVDCSKHNLLHARTQRDSQTALLEDFIDGL